MTAWYGHILPSGEGLYANLHWSARILRLLNLVLPATYHRHISRRILSTAPVLSRILPYLVAPSSVDAVLAANARHTLTRISLCHRFRTSSKAIQQAINQDALIPIVIYTVVLSLLLLYSPRMPISSQTSLSHPNLYLPRLISAKHVRVVCYLASDFHV